MSHYVIGRLASGAAGLAGLVANFRDDESGAVMGEYAILLTLLGSAVLAAVVGYGSTVEGNVEEVAEKLRKLPKAACPEPSNGTPCR